MTTSDTPICPLLALFCSRSCPGSVILRAYDLAVALRGAGVAVIGGFQTPMEREMLTVLLRGRQPVVVVDARGPRARMPAEWRAASEAGRLRVVSPFDGVRRPTRQTATERNRLVLRAASAVLVVHASPGGQTEALARDAAMAGLPLLTIDSGDDANTNLVALGAIPIWASRDSWPETLQVLAPSEPTA